MRAYYSLALLACVIVLGSCASRQTTNQAELNTQIANLERTENQMRLQYNTMGHTLVRLEARIKELKALASNQQAILTTRRPEPAADAAPPPQPAPAREPVVARTEEEAKPMQLVVPQADVPLPAPASGELSADDMIVQPATTTTEVTAPAEAKPSAPEAAAPQYSYLVHLASYLDTAPIKPGWEELSHKYAEPLEGLTPYLTPFRDNQDRRWMRLSVGALPNYHVASLRCEAYKKASGEWCEVLRVTTSAMRELH